MMTSLRYHVLASRVQVCTLASATGIHRPRLHDYLSGTRDIPPSHLAALSAALGVESGQLNGWVTDDALVL